MNNDRGEYLVGRGGGRRFGDHAVWSIVNLAEPVYAACGSLVHISTNAALWREIRDADRCSDCVEQLREEGDDHP